MTWHKVELPVRTRSAKVAWDHVREAHRWCEHNLSSNGVLWKHEHAVDWTIFYFAQSQDVIVFKLKFG